MDLGEARVGSWGSQGRAGGASSWEALRLKQVGACEEGLD